jgi:predicted MFS family arabinose efflux permease
VARPFGAGYWVLYGAGAIAGPMLTGLLADRVGFRRAYLVALLMQAVAVALPVASSHAVVVGISAVALGAFTPGVVPLAVGRIHEILPGDPIAQSAAWGRATIFFALFQALSGYGYSFLFNASGGNYEIMFVVAATALVIASGAQLAGRWLPAKATAPATRSGIAL